MKGRPNANLYTYDPEATEGSGLHPPAVASGRFARISRIQFCYDLEPEVFQLNVTKDARTSFTRAHNWTIGKSVTPEGRDLFEGDNATSEYRIDVERDAGTDSNWTVNGIITVENPAPQNATVTGIEDILSGPNGTEIPATLVDNLTFPVTLAQNESPTIAYRAAPPEGGAVPASWTATTTASSGPVTARISNRSISAVSLLNRAQVPFSVSVEETDYSRA